MKQKGFSPLIILIAVAILGLAGYFVYQNYFVPKGTILGPYVPGPTTGQSVACTQEAKLCPDGSAVGRTGPNCEFAPCPSPGNGPTISSPKADSRVTSPLTVEGTVSPGWMFEGVFPIKLLDSNRKLIVQGQAKETVPGSWQDGTVVYFSATLKFSTNTKSGFIILENDNPSGDPSRSKTFEVPISF